MSGRKPPAWQLLKDRLARRKADAALAERGVAVELREESAEAKARRSANAKALAKAGIKVAARAPRMGRR